MGKTAIDQIKVWITPGLVSILGLFLWRDLNELRSDVKVLLAQSTADHTKLIQLEQDVNSLKQRVFFGETKTDIKTIKIINEKKTN
jgi:hypothetical protein